MNKILTIRGTVDDAIMRMTLLRGAAEALSVIVAPYKRWVDAGSSEVIGASFVICVVRG